MVKALQERAEAADTKAGQAEAELATAREEVEALQEKIIAATSTTDRTAAELAAATTLREEIAGLRAETQDLTVQLEVKSVHLEEKERELEELAGEVCALEEEAKEAKEAWEAQWESLKAAHKAPPHPTRARRPPHCAHLRGYRLSLRQFKPSVKSGVLKLKTARSGCMGYRRNYAR